MCSAAAAIAWEFRQRHRWGLIVLTGYMLVLGAIKLVIVVLGLSVTLGSEGRFAAVVSVPLTTAFVYLVAAFCYGFDGDLAARRSTYPARMFALPVTTAALTALPMLYGSVVAVIFWLATRVIAIWPPRLDIPVVWPALLAAALLAWAQALTWMPYPLSGLRVIVSVLWLVSIDTIVILALHFKAAEPVMVAFLAPQVPLAYLVARFAVARARRGDVPDWRGAFARHGQIAAVPPRRREHFLSPARAQAWFEWRRQGWSLPGWVGILLPFELALLFVAGTDTPSLVAYTLCGVLLTPPFMAAFAAPRVRRSLDVSDGYAMAPFTTTRPLTSAALIAAKLRMAVWSTLAAWLLVLVAIPAALTLSGTWPVLTERARQLSNFIGTPRAAVVGVLGLSGLMVWTWKQLVQSLYVGLSGREWLIRSSTCLTLMVLIFIEPIALWLHDTSAVRVALWNALPWILGVLVCCKTSAAAWIAMRLYRHRVLSDRTLVTGAAGWLVAVLALYGLLVWLLSTALIPSYVFMLVAILAIPLARVSAAPLTLASNRHR